MPRLVHQRAPRIALPGHVEPAGGIDSQKIPTAGEPGLHREPDQLPEELERLRAGAWADRTRLVGHLPRSIDPTGRPVPVEPVPGRRIEAFERDVLAEVREERAMIADIRDLPPRCPTISHASRTGSSGGVERPVWRVNRCRSASPMGTTVVTTPDRLFRHSGATGSADPATRQKTRGGSQAPFA